MRRRADEEPPSNPGAGEDGGRPLGAENASSFGRRKTVFVCFFCVFFFLFCFFFSFFFFFLGFVCFFFF